MKRNRLLNRITLGVACLLGVGGAITAGVTASNDTSKVAEATGYDTVSTITLANIIANKTSGTYGDWEWTAPDDYLGDNVTISTKEGQNYAWKVSYIGTEVSNITHVSVSASVGSGDLCYLFFNGNTQTSDMILDLTKEKDLKGQYSTSVGFDLHPSGETGSAALVTGLTLSVMKVGSAIATITAGTGVQSVYLSTNVDAKSGDPSGTEYPSGTRVYAFAVMEGGYWIDGVGNLVSGEVGEPGSIFRITDAYLTSDHDFGTINAEQIDYAVTITPSIYGITSVYLSKNQDATSGSSSGTVYHYGETIYGFVEMDPTYVKQDDWVEVGTNKYRVASLVVSATAENHMGTFGPKCKIHLKNGTETVSTLDAIEGSYLSYLSSYQIPSRQGYTFIGYYTTQSGSGYKIFDANGYPAVYAWNGDGYEVDIYARFTKDMQYTVTGFNGDFDNTNKTIQINITDPAPELATIEYGTNGTDYPYSTPPSYKDVGTYTIYYRINATDGDVVYTTVIGSKQVKINRVDRTALESLITEANTFYNSIKDDSTFDSISGPLHTAITNANTFNDDDNKTYEEIQEAIATLRDAYDTSRAGKATILINNIPAPEYTSEYKANLDAIKAYYDGLTEEEKALVDENVYQHLLDYIDIYNHVDHVYGLINDIGEPSYTATYKAEIDDAREAYDHLTAAELSLVSADTLKVLTDNEAVYGILNKINKIYDTETVKDYNDKVDEARDAYDSASSDQKAMVPTSEYKILTDAEEALDVINEIDAIGSPVFKPEWKERIDSARNHYEDLDNDAQKEFVKQINYDQLTHYEAVYEHADTASKKINDIGEVKLTDECKALIDNARNYYDGLTQEEKDIIPHYYKVLVDAESVYNGLKKINDIGTVEFTNECKARIDEARNHYDSLSEEQKESLGSEWLQKLVDAEKTYEAFGKINAIGEVSYTNECKGKIDAARNYYDSLTAKEKEMVGADWLKKLTDAEKAYEALGKIYAIGDVEYTDASLKKIQDARKNYDSLTQDQKDRVSKEGLQVLLDAEKVYEALGKINAIGEVTYSDESKALIEEARQYYESLTDAQKAKVNGVDLATLVEDEAKYESLRTSGTAVSVVFLILAIILFLAGAFVLFLILKNRNNKDDDNQGGNGSNKKGEVKTASVSIVVPAILASLYGQGAFVVLYIFIGLAVLVWATDIVLFFLFKPKGMKAFDYCKYLFNKTFRKNKVEEPLPVKEEVKEEVEEKVVPQVDEESGDEEVVTVADSKGNIFQIRFNKSFTAKIIQASEESKKYYEELKNYVLSYKGTTSRISWNYDSINSGRNPVVKFGVRGKTLCVYYPLDADQYNDTKYKVEKIDSKKFESVPTMYRIKNDRRLGYAKDLIDTVMASLGLSKGDEKHESYILPYEENKPLVARGLIKEHKVQVNKPAEVVLDKKVNAEGDEIVTTRDSKGNIFEIRFIKSFTAKLSQSSDEVKNQYNELKNYVLGYKKANSRISWYFDSINVGKDQLLKFAIRGKTLCLYYALNEEELDAKYKVEKSEAKKYEAVPTLYRIKNERRFSYAKELIDLLMKKFNVERGKESNEDYRIPYEETEALLKKGLIKEVKTKVNKPVIEHESISVEEADKKMSDAVAEAAIKEDTSSKRHVGKKAIVNIDTIGEVFNDNDEITLEALIVKKLVPSNTGYVKVLARGSLNKKLHVDLQDYSIQAVKMILLEGGTVKKAK